MSFYFFEKQMNGKQNSDVFFVIPEALNELKVHIKHFYPLKYYQISYCYRTNENIIIDKQIE